LAGRHDRGGGAMRPAHPTLTGTVTVSVRGDTTTSVGDKWDTY